MDKYYYYIVGTLIAAAVTIIPKVLPLFFLKGKTFNKKLMTFFKIVPYTSMSVLILRSLGCRVSQQINVYGYNCSCFSSFVYN